MQVVIWITTFISYSCMHHRKIYISPLMSYAGTLILLFCFNAYLNEASNKILWMFSSRLFQIDTEDGMQEYLNNSVRQRGVVISV